MADPGGGCPGQEEGDRRAGVHLVRGQAASENGGRGGWESRSPCSVHGLYRSREGRALSQALSQANGTREAKGQEPPIPPPRFPLPSTQAVSMLERRPAPPTPKPTTDATAEGSKKKGPKKESGDTGKAMPSQGGGEEPQSKAEVQGAGELADGEETVKSEL